MEDRDRERGEGVDREEGMVPEEEETVDKLISAVVIICGSVRGGERAAELPE